MDWFYIWQYTFAGAFILATPYALEGKRIFNLLKERFLAKKGYIKAEFIGFNKRRMVKIVKPDDNGMFKSSDGAYFLHDGTENFEIKKNKFDIEKGEKKIVEGNMPVYTFVAGSSQSHDYFNRDELNKVGTGKQVNQTLLSAEGVGEIELLKKLIANKKLLYAIFGVAIAIALSVYFSYENYNLLKEAVRVGVLV